MNSFILIAGPSGTGKTTLLQKLKADYGLRETLSHTTRERRPTDTDECYKFVSREEFQQIPMVEYTEYNGNLYGTAISDIDNSDILVADLHGCMMIQSYMKSINRPCLTIGLNASAVVRAYRMRNRGDKEEDVQSRINHDASAFAQLRKVADVVFPDFSMEQSYTAVCNVINNWR